MEHDYSVKQKILDLCLRWHVLRSYGFEAEVTFKENVSSVKKVFAPNSSILRSNTFAY